MNSKMMAAGLALVLVAMALPSNAYHIRDNPAATNGTSSGFEPLEWGSRIGVNYPAPDPFTNDQEPCATLRMVQGLVLDPTLNAAVDSALDILCTDAPAWNGGDSLFGLTACEVNPDPSVNDPGNSGIGGLCFMSQGCANGVSDGQYDAYDGLACRDAGLDSVVDGQTVIPATAVARNWVALQMVVPGTGAVNFVGQIGGLDCGIATSTFVYDEQFAYTIDGGHVAGFPAADPTPGTFGTYTVNAGNPTGMTNCAPYPFYY